MEHPVPPSGSLRVRQRPPPSGWVVEDPEAPAAEEVDWTRWYVTDEEDMGESAEQRDDIRLFESSLAELGRERSWADVYIGSNTFFAWRPEHPLVRVSPDVYLLDNPPTERSGSWQTWQPGVRPPRFALEIVSINWKKDYDDAPARYSALGCGELVIFDPKATSVPAGRRQTLMVYRRREDGPLTRVYAGRGPAWSMELNASLVPTVVDGYLRLRIARDAEGRDIVNTTDEQRAVEAAGRAAEAAGRAEESRARARAEDEVVRLKAELERLRKG